MGVLQVKVLELPTKSKANRELINLLSQLLKISKGSVNIIKGPTIRSKVIAILWFEPERSYETAFI